jgi:molybdopterin synthase sulfur carrier subunit
MNEATTQGGADRLTIRVTLPFHLRNLAAVGPEISLEVTAPITIGRVLDALEDAYPMLRGTIREYETGRRRAFLRFFACQEDLSNEGLEFARPADVVSGREPLMVIGAIAGG